MLFYNAILTSFWPINYYIYYFMKNVVQVIMSL